MKDAKNSKYTQKLDNKKREIIDGILRMVVNKIPSAEYALVYGVPGLKFKNKNLIAVAAHKDHLGVYPCSPAVMKEFIKNHPHIDYAKGTLRFSFENLPEENLIEEIIALRSKEVDSEK